MAKRRQYTAQADTGRDYIECQFWSEHRAGSRANFDDARAEYRRRHGHAPRILRTVRDDATY